VTAADALFEPRLLIPVQHDLGGYFAGSAPCMIELR